MASGGRSIDLPAGKTPLPAALAKVVSRYGSIGNEVTESRMRFLYYFTNAEDS
jgi:hypothetical protein